MSWQKMFENKMSEAHCIEVKGSVRERGMFEMFITCRHFGFSNPCIDFSFRHLDRISLPFNLRNHGDEPTFSIIMKPFALLTKLVGGEIFIVSS